MSDLTLAVTGLSAGVLMTHVVVGAVWLVTWLMGWR